jgi:2-oxo-3-hexenedioate decarboxylase
MNNKTKSIKTQSQAIAADILAAFNECRQIAPLSGTSSGLTLDLAYEVAAAVRQMRQERGERPIGRKIGFTNSKIWPEYNVFAPIWGDVYDTTLHELGSIGGIFDISAMLEPRIEPEIAFGLARAPDPDMNESELFSCIEWVAHGFEIVHSLFPNWQFGASDTVAAFGLHGAYLIGPRQPISDAQSTDWFKALTAFEITLKRDAEFIDSGHATNVLGGPLSALLHLVRSLSKYPNQPPLAKGEMVTTGTLTGAFPIAPGETWRTTFSGAPLEGITARFV